MAKKKPEKKPEVGTDFYEKKGKKSILVPLSPETHKKVRIAAAVAGVSMYAWIVETIETELKRLTS